MKFSSVRTILHLCFIASVVVVAQETEGLDDKPSFALPMEYDDKPSSHRYIVKFKPGSIEFEKRLHRARRRNLRRTATLSQDESLLTYGSFIPKDNAEVVYLKSDKEVQEWNEKEEVEYVEPDSKVYPLGDSLWTKEEIPYGIDYVHALNVSDAFVSNRKICIIDSGYHIKHRDLPSQNVTGYDGPFTAGPWNEDGSGHGTHVAGTIAALGGNNMGVAGVIRNGQANLHIVRVFNNDGMWAWRSTLIAAVEECVDSGSNVINMSLGGPRASKVEYEVFERVLNEDNVLAVAAAGNGRGGLTVKSYPAAYPAVMAVAATNADNEIASFSTRHEQVNIAAPGRYIMSTLPWSVVSETTKLPWGKYSGTSMACPHVVGVAALVWSHDTSKSAKDMRSILQGTADDLGEPGRDNLFGHGLVRADKAYEMLIGEANYTIAPTPSPTKLYGYYCNHRGCDGLPSGGDWCNAAESQCVGNCQGQWCRKKTEGYCTNSNNGCDGDAWTGWCGENKDQCGDCGGIWCYNEFDTTAPTSSPSAMPTTSSPTVSPTKSLTPSSVPSTTPSVQPTTTSGPSSEPTLSPTTLTPTKQASFNPSSSPTTSPTAQPTSCSDDPNDLFFLHYNVDKDKPLYKTCAFLAEKDMKRIKGICTKNIDSYDGVGPAMEVCKETCGLCPTESPSESPSDAPTASPTETASDAPSISPTETPSDAPTLSACCSQDYKTCGGDAIPDWCELSEQNCNDCGGIIIIPPKEDCIAKWGVCTNNVNGCCKPGVCGGNEFWKQCS